MRSKKKVKKTKKASKVVKKAKRTRKVRKVKKLAKRTKKVRKARKAKRTIRKVKKIVGKKKIKRTRRTGKELAAYKKELLEIKKKKIAEKKAKEEARKAEKKAKEEAKKAKLADRLAKEKAKLVEKETKAKVKAEAIAKVRKSKTKDTRARIAPGGKFCITNAKKECFEVLPNGTKIPMGTYDYTSVFGNTSDFYGNKLIGKFIQLPKENFKSVEDGTITCELYEDDVMLPVHKTDAKYKEWEKGNGRLFFSKYTMRIKLANVNGVAKVNDIKKTLEIS